LGGAALEWLGKTDTNIFLNNWLLASLGIVGNLVQLILIINTVLFVNFLVLATPLYFIWRDFRATLQRFRIVLNPSELSSEKEQKYLDAAARIFAEDPDTVIFIYGHTHMPSVRPSGRRLVINTGTWLKRFEETPTRFGFLPRLFVPVFCLNYFRISEAEGKIAIDYHQIDKAPPKDLDLLQRLLISRKRRLRPDPIAERTWVEI
jgi:hypothetical protein